MIKFFSIPLVAYILTIPVVAAMQSYGGRKATGESAIEEYLVIVGLLFIWNIFRIIRKRGFTSL